MAKKKMKEEEKENGNGIVPVLCSDVNVYYDTTSKDYFVTLKIEGKHYRFENVKE